MMLLVVNGTPYTGFTSASATRALRTLANDFAFTASAVTGFPDVKEGDTVEVLVDDELILTGSVEEINGRLSEGSHTITYTGRDKTGDLIDSNIDVLADIRASASLTLSKLIQIVLDHLKLDIEVVDNFEPAPFNQAEDIIAPEVGQDAIEFLMAYARKRQALLTSDGQGRITITQADPIDSDAVLQYQAASDTNNILTQDWSLKSSVRFNRYVRRGQLEPRALNFSGDTGAGTVENQSGVKVDNTVRVGRQQVQVESDSYSSEQLLNRAKWARQLAEAEATQFSCTAKGHTSSAGEVWNPNTLVQINSEAADISRKMLLDSVTFSQAEGSPTASSLQFVERNVYTINEAVLAQKPAGSQNDAYKDLEALG